jgi:hypothetical protein
MKKKVILLTFVVIALGLITFYFISSSRPLEQAAEPSESSKEELSVATAYPDNGEKPDTVAEGKVPLTPSTQVQGKSPVQNQGGEQQIPKQDTWRIKLVERLEPILQERLSSEGFNQYEIDIAAKEVISEYEDFDGTINFADAVNRTARTLNFNDEKKSKLNLAVLKSAAQSMEMTFEQWNQCLSYRVRTMPQCVQDIAQDLSRAVAAATSGQSLLGEELSANVELSKKAMSDAVAKCGISADEADRALRIVLSDCP